MNTAELCARTGTTPRQIRWWATLGYLSDRRDKASPSVPHTWQEEDVRAAWLISLVARKGVSFPAWLPEAIKVGRRAEYRYLTVCAGNLAWYLDPEALVAYLAADHPTTIYVLDPKEKP